MHLDLIIKLTLKKQHIVIYRTNQQKAITCLKEINISYSDLSKDIVALVDSNHNDQLSIGYQVHLQARTNHEKIQNIIQNTT